MSLIEQVADLLAQQRPNQDEELYQILDATGVPVRSIKRRGGGWLAETFLGCRAHPSPRLNSVGTSFSTSVADRAYAAEARQLHWLHDYHAGVLTQPHTR